jgi:hypothetical protein
VIHFHQTGERLTEPRERQSAGFFLHMTDLISSIDVSAQGGLFRLHVTRPDVRRVVVNAKRGLIYEFSRRSRKRLLELSARLDYSHRKTVFLTLTYPAVFPSPKIAKQHMVAMFKRLARASLTNSVGCIWRLEFQKRDAPHFHLMLFGLPFIDKSVIQQMWMDVIGTQTRVFTRIEMIHSSRHARYYIAKYISKVPRPKSRFCSVKQTPTGHKGRSVRRWRGFNTVPYSAAHSTRVNKATGEILENHTGRWWGVLQRSALPFAELLSIEFKNDYYQLLYRMKRNMRRAYSRTTKHCYRGGVILCSNASRWYELVLFELFRLEKPPPKNNVLYLGLKRVDT